MTYQMKDLGYTQTPTAAWMQVTMPDGSAWKVPLQIIADSRDEHYREDQEDTIGFIRDGSLTDYEIYDWAAGNMDWTDVEDFAVKEVPAGKVDYQGGGINGSKRIIGNIFEAGQVAP